MKYTRLLENKKYLKSICSTLCTAREIILYDINKF